MQLSLQPAKFCRVSCQFVLLSAGLLPQYNRSKHATAAGLVTAARPVDVNMFEWMQASQQTSTEYA